MEDEFKEGDRVDAVHRFGGRVVSVEKSEANGPTLAVVEWGTGLREVYLVEQLRRAKRPVPPRPWRPSPDSPRRTKLNMVKGIVGYLARAGADPDLEDADAGDLSYALHMALCLATELEARIKEERCEKCPTDPRFVACPSCRVVT